MEKVLVSWSGGKDSAMSLYEIQKDRRYEVSALLTTVTQGYDRISMHGVRNELLEQQASSIGFPLEKVFISKESSNEEYEFKMRELLERYLSMGISSVVFGDIFLEDLRRYREDNLARLKMTGIFPIWKKDTARLAKKFINLGFKTIITCIDSKVLDKKFAGRMFDERFLSEIPRGIDPCGENGEFHSFVFDGPIFKRGVNFKKGEIVLREERFYYCDLIPKKR